MYYEEKMINGVMHWRGSPNEEFRPYALKELSERYAKILAQQNHLALLRENRRMVRCHSEQVRWDDAR